MNFYIRYITRLQAGCSTSPLVEAVYGSAKWLSDREVAANKMPSRLQYSE
jgi:hypothetical protein